MQRQVFSPVLSQVAPTLPLNRERAHFCASARPTPLTSRIVLSLLFILLISDTRNTSARPLINALPGALTSWRCCGVAAHVALISAPLSSSSRLDPQSRCWERQQQAGARSLRMVVASEGKKPREEQPRTSGAVSSAQKPVPPPSPATSTSASASAVSPSSSSLTGDSSSSLGPAAQRYNAPLSRRAHAKSRLGCFTCKRRRVKCNEGRPVCGGCHRLGLQCGYPSQPAPESVGALITSSASTSEYTSSTGGPQAAIPMLTLQDLRFYHQFLTVAFPALPLKADWIWPQCAAMSHQVRSKTSRLALWC